MYSRLWCIFQTVINICAKASCSPSTYSSHLAVEEQWQFLASSCPSRSCRGTARGKHQKGKGVRAKVLLNAPPSLVSKHTTVSSLQSLQSLQPWLLSCRCYFENVSTVLIPKTTMKSAHIVSKFSGNCLPPIWGFAQRYTKTEQSLSG